MCLEVTPDQARIFQYQLQSAIGGPVTLGALVRADLRGVTIEKFGKRAFVKLDSMAAPIRVRHRFKRGNGTPVAPLIRFEGFRIPGVKGNVSCNFWDVEIDATDAAFTIVRSCRSRSAVELVET
ncbi:MAG TPA: hypothetical protein VNK70_03215 [Candidatus Paceibacterota bacterium]|nr:hypothetical protein [Candidatus Paceibacterota bacterium]